MQKYICYVTPNASIAVCEAEYWEKHGHLDDRHNRELSLLMRNLNFTELRENEFWRPNLYSVEMALSLLQSNGFKVIEYPSQRTDTEAEEA